MMDLETIFANYQPKPLGTKRFYAVMIPVIEIAGERVILYESRAYGISQGGDTAFPGGRVEKGESFQVAAVRETMEEIGVAREQIQVLGEMDYLVSQGSVVACFVANIHISSLSELMLNEDEVAYVFTMPIRELLQQRPEKYMLRGEGKLGPNFPFDRIPGGKNYPFNRKFRRVIPFYDAGDQSLWGMTARLTERFIDIIREEAI